MAGYSIGGVFNTNKGLNCLHCKLLLKNPVQTEEGERLCRTCFEEIRSLPGHECKDCGICIPTETCYPDKAAKREILKLCCCCPFKEYGCLWEGILKNREDHIEECSYKPTPCPYGYGQLIGVCGQLTSWLEVWEHCPHFLAEFGNRKQEDELPADEYSSGDSDQEKFARPEENELPTDECSSGDSDQEEFAGPEENELPADEYSSGDSDWEKFARPKPRSSLASDVVTPVLTPVMTAVRNSHSRPASMEILSERTGLVASCGPVDPGLSSPGTVKPHNFTSSSHNMQLSKSEGRDLFSLSLKHYEKIKAIQAGVEKVHAQLQTSKKLQQKQLQKMEDTVEDIKAGIRLSLKHYEKIKAIQAGVEKVHVQLQTRKKLQQKQQQKQQQKMEDTVEDIKADIRDLKADNYIDMLQEQVAVLTEQVTQLECLVDLLLSTHNDGFIWMIPDISKHRTDAIDRRVTSIYSPPFYSGRNGYKMRLCAYFNGDGVGYQTHLSLFFVIMRGESDNSLVWPFPHNVSMILVDQTHRKHIVQTFKPTPESNSFQQPMTEMNVASGCPQFATLSVLDDPSYVKDDVMFIKCILDTTNISR